MRFKKRPPELAVSSRRRPVVSENRPAAFSYYGRRTQPTDSSPHAADRQPGRSFLPPRQSALKYIGQRFGSLIAIVAVLILVISSIQVSMNPRLVVLNDTGVYRVHSNQVYQQSLVRLLRSSWTNSNKITFDSHGLATRLQAEYPELADVSVTLPLVGQRPMAYVQLTLPKLILVTTTNQAFVLDEKGRALASTAQVENLSSFNLPTVTDQSGLTVHTGENVLTPASVTFIDSVLYQLKTAGVPLGKLVLPQGSEELDVSISGKPYIVKFNTHEANGREQAGAYLAVRDQLTKQGITPTQYVDVRLAGRAYYK